MQTVLEIIKKTTDFLAAKGVESARLNAETIIGHALGLKRMQLYLQFERTLAEPELDKIRPLVRRRGQREPLQYILGEVEFAGVKLKVDRRALIPRPETEMLIDLLKTRLTTPPKAVLDLGTGTGAIALALATLWPEAVVTAVDESEDALALARDNASAAGLAQRVSFISSDWFKSVPAGRFDLIVSNPPYLTADETADAQPEVRDFEPKSALVAGEAGMSDLLTIIAKAPDYLAAGGVLALETGIAQHAQLAAAVERAGLKNFASIKDLTGRDRFVMAAVDALGV